MFELFKKTVLLLAALLAFSQDVFVPPVPRGIARGGKVRKVKQPIPFPREGQAWIRVRTARFDVISSAAEGRTRAIARDLESLAAALTEASPRFETSKPMGRLLNSHVANRLRRDATELAQLADVPLELPVTGERTKPR